MLRDPKTGAEVIDPSAGRVVIWQCLNCMTKIKQNYIEKCNGCGSKRVRLLSGEPSE